MERNIIIQFPKNGNLSTISTGIISGSMKLDRIACSGETLVFNELGCACFSLSILTDVDLTGEYIRVVSTDYVNENSINSYTIFEGYIESCVHQKNGVYKDIVAMDELYRVKNINVADWYKSKFQTGQETYTLGQFMNSLCTDELDITFNVSDILLSAITVRKTLNADIIKAEYFLKALCEILCGFAKLSDGVFTITPLNQVTKNITDNVKTSSKYAEYTTPLITGVAIKDSADEDGVLYGIDENVYSIIGNPFFIDTNTDTQESYADMILARIDSISYTPMNIEEIISAFSLNLGDKIQYGDVIGYVMEQHYNGVSLIEGELTCNGNSEVRAEKQYIDDVYQVLNNKYIKVEKTVDEISSRVGNLETNTESAIVQTASTITMNVKRGNDTVSIVLGEVDENNNLVLSAEAKDILLTADNISIVSDNFNVDTLGNVQIKGSNALLQVRDNETFVDISAGKKLIDVYDCPIIVNSYSTLVDENSFRTFGETKSSRIIKVGEYLYTFKQNIVYRANISDIPNLIWEDYRIRDAGNYNVIIQNICEYNGKIVEVGKYIDTNNNVNQYVYADASLNATLVPSGNYSDAVSFKGNLYVINDFGFWCYDGNYWQFDDITALYNYNEQDRVKLKVIDDYLFVISATNGLSIFKQNDNYNKNDNSLSHNEPLVSVVLAEKLSNYNYPTVKDIEKIGTNTYVLLAGNSNLFYSNDIENTRFARCDEIIDGDISYGSTFSYVNYFDMLVNIGESIIAIGRGLDDCLAMQETCNGELFSSVIDSSGIYDYQNETDSAIIYSNYVVTSNYAIIFESFSSISQDKENAKNIFSIQNDGEIQYDGEEFRFGETSDDAWNAIMKIKKGVFTIPEEPEYSIEMKTVNNTDDITRTLNLSCYDGIRFSEEENGTETKRFRISDEYFECYDVENGKYFDLSNSELNIKNDDGVGIKLQTNTTLNGEDDEGLKITPSSNSYCGIDVPYVNDYDMHMSFYTHTNLWGANQNIPSIKVEQRDNTGTRNEVYLLNGDGDTLFPNDVFVGGTLAQSSDRKVKDNIETINEKSAIDLINSLQPVQYTFKKDKSQKLNMGFVAQDVKEVCDNIGIDNFALYCVAEVDKKGNRSKKVNLKKGVSDEELSWGLNYTQLIAPMVATIQNLTKRVEELENKLKK